MHPYLKGNLRDSWALFFDIQEVTLSFEEYTLFVRAISRTLTYVFTYDGM